MKADYNWAWSATGSTCYRVNSFGKLGQELGPGEHPGPLQIQHTHTGASLYYLYVYETLYNALGLLG
jgi:hypothetical protein